MLAAAEVVPGVVALHRDLVQLDALGARFVRSRVRGHGRIDDRLGGGPVNDGGRDRRILKRSSREAVLGEGRRVY